MKRDKDTKNLIKTNFLRRISAVLILATVVLLIFNTVLYIQSNNTALKRYDLSYRATQFMNASAYLTSESRACAATGDVTHYDNYVNETDNLKNRDEAIAKLKELGVTQEEEKLIAKMSQISNDLIPIELQAMELAKKGDIDGALAIVYGDYYNNEIAMIRSLRDELRTTLDIRTAKELSAITTKFNIINIITWILAISVIIIQFVQKNVLNKLAYRDQLTGGLNYYAFRLKMSDGINIPRKGYIIAVDMKNFSIINDVCGIEKGDKILREISKTLENSVHGIDGEIVGHIDGDRFALFLLAQNDDVLIERITKIHADIAEIANAMDIPCLMPTFGIRKIKSTLEPERCYNDANFANRMAKRSATTFYEFFDQQMSKSILEDIRMEDDFDSAIQEHEFEVWYQPKCDSFNEKFVSAEALVRWRKQDGTLVPPGVFIPLFEHNGMIGKLDKYVFNEVCAKIQEWQNNGIQPIPISVNISRASLLRTDVVDQFLNIFKKYNIPAKYIELELTESAMNNQNTLETLKRFRKAGFKILIDDFGVGYSSLSTITVGCFDGLKLDKSLIDKILTPAGKRLAEIIIDIAHEFKMSVVAEGVETKEQTEIIKNLSCDTMQGFYYSRPLYVKDFEKILSA